MKPPVVADGDISFQRDHYEKENLARHNPLVLFRLATLSAEHLIYSNLNIVISENDGAPTS